MLTANETACPITVAHLCRIALALLDIYIRRRTVPEVPGKALRYNKYGEHNARCRIAQSGQFAVAYENLVHYVVKCNFSNSLSGYFCLSSETIIAFCFSLALPQELRHSVFLSIQAPF